MYDLRERFNLFCSVVTYPVIPKGEIILRIIPTAVHTLEDGSTRSTVSEARREKLLKGEYQKEMPRVADKYFGRTGEMTA